MRYPIAIACLVCLLSSLSCASSHHQAPPQVEASVIVPPPPPPPPPPQRPRHKARIASIEHRFSSAQKCTARATAAYQRTHPGANPPLVAGTPQNPQVYSWRRANRDSVEVRFVVQAGSLTEPTDTIINYWDIQKKKSDTQTDADNQEDLSKAYEKLLRDQHCKQLRGPTNDAAQVNGKLPVRAILQTTTPIQAPEDDSADQKMLLPAVSGKFGIIINPPYP